MQILRAVKITPTNFIINKIWCHIHKAFIFLNLVIFAAKKAMSRELETLCCVKVNQFSIPMLSIFILAFSFHTEINKRLGLLENIHLDECYYVQSSKYYWDNIWCIFIFTTETIRTQNKISQNILVYGLKHLIKFFIFNF